MSRRPLEAIIAEMRERVASVVNGQRTLSAKELRGWADELAALEASATPRPEGGKQMSAEKFIGASHPRDGREWDNQCARCGSSMQFVDCDNCGGDGLDGHDCGEDTCCCLDPDDNRDCDWCQGSGGYWACLSSAEWCETHPLEGRESIGRGAVEWFTFDAPRAVSAPGGPGTETP